MALEDESLISEITILPDGRVCLFGASQKILAIFDAILPNDAALKHRMDCLKATNKSQVTEQNTIGSM